MSTATKERPILFSGPMVRAILAGKKTQTRRCVTVGNSLRQASPSKWPFNLNRAWRGRGFPQLRDGHKAEYLHVPFCHPEDGWDENPQMDTVERWYPRYRPGRRLWVRETWCRKFTDGTPAYNEDGNLDSSCCWYRASNPEVEAVDEDGYYRFNRNGKAASPWRPSIHMPRWASRLTLEITDVRVQRVQEISGRDCAAEGCDPNWDEFVDATIGADGWEEPEEFIEECEDECDWINFGNRLVHSREHKEWERDRLNYALRLSFGAVWDSINSARGFGWKANPWVWAITFEVVK